MLPSKTKLTALLFITTISIVGCGSSFSDDDSHSSEPISDIEPSTDSPYSEYNASWLAGSWGITQRIDGGYKLDASANSSYWVAGANEVIANIPSAGHVITSFTHPAHAYLFTLRTNNNVDVAAIHADMVPTLTNEQIIFDVINIYREAGIKVILYLNAAGPSMATGRGDPEIQEAWETFYKTEWEGDEAAAWRNLVLGYAERFDGLVDGYWLDNVSNLPGELSDFIAMLRSVDPTLAIGVNLDKDYFTDDNGDFLYVDTDGFDDADETDYKIVKYAVNNKYTDFTSGHVTPLGQGAPPNSWAYEEYTIPDMVKKPWDTYDGSTYAVKHGWFPIRDKWSGSTANLIFEVEQAYRFTRTITDAGAAMTWSTTQNHGYITADEMEIMAEISDRMTQTPKEDYVEYERPEGAYLLSETH
ncbi:hypothetical protein [Paraglaciecola sp. L3A3]|uniref:hypothetical protein n=1 Tax=Paraglaciecola sp. L3A3 TaxID=2686358 RepID=UPI00131DE6A4|nr:hypothetical protein [Paraglaciecola sp. L3A3]